MSDQPLFTVRAVKDAKGLHLCSETEFLRLVQRLKAGEYTLSVERFVETRSLHANKYYWKVVVGTVAEYMGEDDPNYVHELLKLKCNPHLVLNRKTGEVEAVGGTTRIPSPEFWDYIKRIQRWAIQHCNGLYIPDPNESLVGAA